MDLQSAAAKILVQEVKQFYPLLPRDLAYKKNLAQTAHL